MLQCRSEELSNTPESSVLEVKTEFNLDLEVQNWISLKSTNKFRKSMDKENWTRLWPRLVVRVTFTQNAEEKANVSESVFFSENGLKNGWGGKSVVCSSSRFDF